jgi:hypothetical protein
MATMIQKSSLIQYPRAVSWALTGHNGGQGYHNKGNAQKAVKRLIEDVAQIYHTSQG